MEEVNKLGKILIVDDNEDVLFAPQPPTGTVYGENKGGYYPPIGSSIS